MNQRYVRSQSVLAFAAIVALPGCMQSRVDESRELHTHIEKSEAVVILPKPQVEGAAAEEGFVDCVGGGLAGHGDSAIAVRRHNEFVDSTFPWFEPGTAPSRPEAIEQLLTRSESRELHTHIEKSEAVVILPKPQVEGAAAEEGFVDCVGGGLAGHGDSAIAVRRHNEFVDSTFPWFEPGTAPSRPEAIEQLLTRPG